jgi:hypothetical protein
VKSRGPASQTLPRIVPRRERIQAIQGTWIFHGEKVQLLEEPGTGVLLALTLRGVPINPMQVISRGSKIEAA